MRAKQSDLNCNARLTNPSVVLLDEVMPPLRLASPLPGASLCLVVGQGLLIISVAHSEKRSRMGVLMFSCSSNTLARRALAASGAKTCDGQSLRFLA